MSWRLNGGSVISPECPLGTDAHMRRAGGVLQRRGAEEERRVGWMEGARCYRAATGMLFAGANGVSRVVVGRAYDLQAPYRRVRYPDDVWEGAYSPRNKYDAGLRDAGAPKTGDYIFGRTRAQGGMEGRLRGKAHLTVGMPALGRR